MENILLVFASPKNKKNYINRLPPLGILSLAAYLEERGISVDIIDCNVERFMTFRARDYDLVGFSINIANIENSVALIKTVSKMYPKIPLVVGGPLPTISPERFFSLPVKAIFISEAENSFLEYLRNPESEENKGYYFKNKNNKWCFNGVYPYIENLDTFPFPALEKINIYKYYTPVKRSFPVSILISSRGCPFSCTFCCKTLGDKFRARSPENVVDEIGWQVEKLGAKEILIYDDNFTLDKDRANEVFDLIIERNIKVNFQLTNGVRADSLNFELLKKMKKAGVWMLALAPESGNHATLRKIAKGFDLEQVERVIGWCRSLDIKIWAFFMIGFPWEDAEMVKQTIDYAVKIKTDLTQFSITFPFPKTELYDQAFHEKDKSLTLQDISLFHLKTDFLVSNLSQREIRRLLIKAYLSVYFRLSKILNLISLFSAKDLFRIAWYTVKTVSIF